MTSASFESRGATYSGESLHPVAAMRCESLHTVVLPLDSWMMPIPSCSFALRTLDDTNSQQLQVFPAHL